MLNNFLKYFSLFLVWPSLLRVFQLHHLSYIRVMDDVGISLAKRPGKAHLELLVAALQLVTILRKFLWCTNFAVSPNSQKNNAKIELLEK